MDTHTHLATNVREFLGLNAPSATVEQVAVNQMLLYLANGVTTIFNLGDFGELLPLWAKEVEQGTKIGPTIYSAMYARGYWRSTEFFGPLLEAIRQQYQAAN